MQPAVRDGRIRALGASNWPPARLLAAEQAARARSLVGFSCSQCCWSLAESNPVMQGMGGMFCVDRDALEFHRETKLPLLAYSAQAQGFFAQSWTWPDLPNPTPKQKALLGPYYSEKNVGRWQRATELARRRHCPIGAVVLAYVTRQDFPTAAIIGPRSLEQLRLSLAAGDLELSPAEIRFLEGEGS
jgi:aryl-alcohol dehydrogenase-like predicted oxidoreductase